MGYFCVQISIEEIKLDNLNTTLDEKPMRKNSTFYYI